MTRKNSLTSNDALKNKIGEIKPEPKFLELNDNVELYLSLSGDTVLRDKLRDPNRKIVWHTPTDQ